MEITMKPELGLPFSYQAEIVLMHGGGASYETLWLTLNDEDQAILLYKCCDAIIYKGRASGWDDPDCSLEDISARIAAILNTTEDNVHSLLEHFCYDDCTDENATVKVERLRLFYFDASGTMFRLVLNEQPELPMPSRISSNYSFK